MLRFNPHREIHPSMGRLSKIKEESNTMSKYGRMLILLGTVVLLSTLTASGSSAQQPQDETGLFENVFGRSEKVPIELSEVPLPVQLAMRTVVSEMTRI